MKNVIILRLQDRNIANAVCLFFELIEPIIAIISVEFFFVFLPTATTLENWKKNLLSFIELKQKLVQMQ